MILCCVDHPAAANQVFLVSDGEDLSTTELLQRVGLALGRSVWLFYVPVVFLNFTATLLGKRNMVHRLLGSLQLDITKTQELLNWQPPVNIDEALQKTARAFLQQK